MSDDLFRREIPFERSAKSWLAENTSWCDDCNGLLFNHGDLRIKILPNTETWGFTVVNESTEEQQHCDSAIDAYHYIQAAIAEYDEEAVP